MRNPIPSKPLAAALVAATIMTAPAMAAPVSQDPDRSMATAMKICRETPGALIIDGDSDHMMSLEECARQIVHPKPRPEPHEKALAHPICEMTTISRLGAGRRSDPALPYRKTSRLSARRRPLQEISRRKPSNRQPLDLIRHRASVRRRLTTTNKGELKMKRHGKGLTALTGSIPAGRGDRRRNGLSSDPSSAGPSRPRTGSA
jgi:hypothetical protein